MGVMESTRIGRSRVDASLGRPSRRGAANDAVRPIAGDARQLSPDALHFAAAVVGLDRGAAVVLRANPAFDRLAAPFALQILSILADVTTFLVGGEMERMFELGETRAAGRHFRVHFARLAPLAASDQRALISVVDRTAEVETERSLRTEMLHDSLTGLPNRLNFSDAIDAAIGDDAGGAGVAVLAINLMRFSRINECVGALSGDELIITVARRLVSALHEGETLARMGGDEFGLLVRCADGPVDTLQVAERMCAAMAGPVRLADLEIRVECAIGCALLGKRASTAADLLRDAQIAMKHAKRSGRIEFYRANDAGASRRRFSLETELHHAIERDQLSLAFQPLFDLERNAVAGFEALARWEHPDLGLIEPTEFVAIAEECGLIVPLGRWALEAAMQTQVKWDIAAGRTLPLYFCVNVSPVQLARDSVGDAVRSALAGARVGGGRLIVELTESSIVADPGRAKLVLDALKSIDCRIAMDDFGTGYSSLASLQRLPIDILKIDRSFVHGMLDDRDSVAIVRAILGLADALGMATTAEGIENSETARMLAALGCTTGQGFHFARPLPDDEALAFYQASRARA